MDTAHRHCGGDGDDGDEDEVEEEDDGELEEFLVLGGFGESVPGLYVVGVVLKFEDAAEGEGEAEGDVLGD